MTKYRGSSVDLILEVGKSIGKPLFIFPFGKTGELVPDVESVETAQNWFKDSLDTISPEEVGVGVL